MPFDPFSNPADFFIYEELTKEQKKQRDSVPDEDGGAVQNDENDHVPEDAEGNDFNEELRRMILDGTGE